jgi:hypothetical protein
MFQKVSEYTEIVFLKLKGQSHFLEVELHIKSKNRSETANKTVSNDSFLKKV